MNISEMENSESARFRGVLRLMMVLGCVAFSLSPVKALEQGFASIFDGQSLEGWSGDKSHWRVEDGSIVGETHGQSSSRPHSLAYAAGDLRDFELKLEFKVESGGIGVHYRSGGEDPATNRAQGYRLDLSAEGDWRGSVSRSATGALIASPGQKIELGPEPMKRYLLAEIAVPGEILGRIDPSGWNELHIIAYGDHFIQKVNGEVLNEFIDISIERLRSGGIALELAPGSPGKARFRDIRLRRLNRGDKKNVVFLADGKSHDYTTHEYHAGSQLMATALNASDADVIATVRRQTGHDMPWPLLPREQRFTDAVVLFGEGYNKHIAEGHLAPLEEMAARGVGFVCLHYSTEVLKESLGPTLLNWIGGYFEAGWSVNPKWTPDLLSLPDHPIARGVEPFSFREEWYYHLRFRPGLENITPILQAIPGPETLQRDLPNYRSTNPDVERAVGNKESQILAWAYDRPDGGRGFGFTAGHYHQSWAHEDYRKLVLNAIVWAARGEVPQDGVRSGPLSEALIQLNQDFLPPSSIP